MTTNVSPEQRELEAKRAELAQLETELSQRELDLTTLQTELRAFEARYLRLVGPKFAERDALHAQIAEAVARQRPLDIAADREARDSRAQAIQSAEAANHASSIDVDESFTPTDDLKKLFRDIAKLVHPDLTTDDRERERRHRIMAAANQAFAAGDANELHRLLDEWETSPDFVEGEGIAADLVRTIRKIHQVKQRLSQIDDAFRELRCSELYDLKERYDAALTLDRDLLAEVADQMDADIAELKVRLGHVLKEVAT